MLPDTNRNNEIHKQFAISISAEIAQLHVYSNMQPFL